MAWVFENLCNLGTVSHVSGIIKDYGRNLIAKCDGHGSRASLLYCAALVIDFYYIKVGLHETIIRSYQDLKPILLYGTSHLYHMKIPGLNI